MRSYSIFVTFTLLVTSLAIENGLGRTPQMGWNPWNRFGCWANETLIK